MHLVRGQSSSSAPVTFSSESTTVMTSSESLTRWQHYRRSPPAPWMLVPGVPCRLLSPCCDGIGVIWCLPARGGHRTLGDVSRWPTSGESTHQPEISHISDSRGNQAPGVGWQRVCSGSPVSDITRVMSSLSSLSSILGSDVHVTKSWRLATKTSPMFGDFLRRDNW